MPEWAVNDLFTLTGFKYAINSTHISQFGQKVYQVTPQCAVADSKKRLFECKPLLTGVAQTFLYKSGNSPDNAMILCIIAPFFGDPSYFGRVCPR